MEKLKKLLRPIKRRLERFIPDGIYLRWQYKKVTGKKLNLKNPQTFNEKLQWLKLHDRKPEYTMMVDKFAVKEYVADKIGAEYVIPTLGVWNHFDEIDFDALPNQFVLKCTHDSGSVVICRDKAAFNMAEAREKIENGLKHNFYWQFREWPYKNVKPRIIAEKYMENNEKELVDYKFYCFNGKPKFLYVSEGLENHTTAKISFLNLDWSFAPYERVDFAPFMVLPIKPNQYENMIKIAKTLSSYIPFIRVDLYEIDNIVYFSELTFFPCGGFMPFKNSEHDIEVGKMLKLTISMSGGGLAEPTSLTGLAA